MKTIIKMEVINQETKTSQSSGTKYSQLKGYSRELKNNVFINVYEENVKDFFGKGIMAECFGSDNNFYNLKDNNIKEVNIEEVEDNAFINNKLENVNILEIYSKTFKDNTSFYITTREKNPETLKKVFRDIKIDNFNGTVEQLEKKLLNKSVNISNIKTWKRDEKSRATYKIEAVKNISIASNPKK
jgi:hypothetical protein